MPAFERGWKRLNLDDDVRRDLEQTLLRNPSAGVLLQETGGIRKVRHGLPGRGKSGSIRVFYFDVPAVAVLFFLAVIKKGEQENLTKAERYALRAQIEVIVKGASTKRPRSKQSSKSRSKR
jgi:hypothetical protein